MGREELAPRMNLNSREENEVILCWHPAGQALSRNSPSIKKCVNFDLGFPNFFLCFPHKTN